ADGVEPRRKRQRRGTLAQLGLLHEAQIALVDLERRPLLVLGTEEHAGDISHRAVEHIDAHRIAEIEARAADRRRVTDATADAERSAARARVLRWIAERTAEHGDHLTWPEDQGGERESDDIRRSVAR